MVPLTQYSDQEIVACAGMDALTYIRFLRLGEVGLLAGATACTCSCIAPCHRAQAEFCHPCAGYTLSIAVTAVAAVLILPTNFAGDYVQPLLDAQAAAGITSTVRFPLLGLLAARVCAGVASLL